MKVNVLTNGSMVIEPSIFEDERGYFFESFNEKRFKEYTGIDFHPVQDNESKSSFGVMRGLHLQNPPYAQAKLVRVVSGKVIDFAVDVRKNSPTYGKMESVLLTADNHVQFFIPRGYAHGFIALEDDTIFQYKCDNYYNKDSEDAIFILDKSFDDVIGKILMEHHLYVDDITLSEKDINNKVFKNFDSKFTYNE